MSALDDIVEERRTLEAAGAVPVVLKALAAIASGEVPQRGGVRHEGVA